MNISSSSSVEPSEGAVESASSKSQSDRLCSLIVLESDVTSEDEVNNVAPENSPKDVDLDEFLDADKLDDSHEDDDLDDSHEDDDLDDSHEEDDLDDSLEEDELDDSLEEDEVDDSLEDDELDDSLKEDELDEVLDGQTDGEDMASEKRNTSKNESSWP